MALFTAGNGTIQATTLENAALVAAQLLQDAENQIGVTDNNIAVSYFSGDNTVTIDATLPVTIGRSATNGQMVIIARDYIQTTFTADGDIKSASLPGAVFEVFQLLELKEKLQVDPDNPDLVNRTAISVDVDNAVVTISATLPITFSAGTDLVTIAANTYLA